MFLDKKLQVDFSFICELPALAICGCEWAFLLGSDHIREHLRGCALSELPLQAMPLIAKVEGRPTGKISALYGSKKPLALE
jgi:hypothetical protein